MHQSRLGAAVIPRSTFTLGGGVTEDAFTPFPLEPDELASQPIRDVRLAWEALGTGQL